jgi:hypothetical protein
MLGQMLPDNLLLEAAVASLRAGGGDAPLVAPTAEGAGVDA